MNRHLKTILLVLFIGIISFLSYQIINKVSHKKEVAQKIKTIPLFSYQDINGKTFTNENLKKATPIIFIYFNTECEYCNEEASMIQKNMPKFKDYQLIFISFEKREQIESFSKYYKLDLYNNVHFLRDNKVTFATTFDVNSLPCIVLYDKNQKLIEKIRGQIKPVILIKKFNIQ